MWYIYHLVPSSVIESYKFLPSSSNSFLYLLDSPQSIVGDLKSLSFLTTEIVDKFLKPFLENLPKNFENMINRVINSMNSFIRTINGFVDKVSGVLGKIGINIDLPKLREFGNVSFGLAEQKVASLTAPAVKSPRDTVSSLLAGQQQMQKQVGQAVMNNTFNISGNTGNPQEVAQKTVEALRQYNRTSGALNRVLTIE